MNEQAVFAGFANPVDPSPAELRTWAYDPNSVALAGLPPDWDLLVAQDSLIATLYDLAADQACPARRFALHCMYIYTADAVRTDFRAHPKRKLKKLIDRAGGLQDENLRIWAANAQALMSNPELFDYAEWCQGGLVRKPRRLLT
ncbi:hypothetical protein [Longispora albida]|uniref:hypothetical protein n=1 Tax=Longispora albida TaxID=203523 RepID=UPI0003813A61|nr:hypothetical protein [Longispora albida]